MAEIETKAESLKPAPFIIETDTMVKEKQRVQSNKYKTVLVAHDISIVAFAFGVSSWLINPVIYPANHFTQIFALFLVCLINSFITLLSATISSTASGRGEVLPSFFPLPVSN